MNNMLYIFVIVGFFYFGFPQKIIGVAMYIYHGYRYKMIFHYVEYSFHGNRHSTWDYGPLDDLAGTGLVSQIQNRGGRILFHQMGRKEMVLEIMNNRKVNK